MTDIPALLQRPDDLPGTVPLDKLLDGYLDHSRKVIRARAHVEFHSMTPADVARYALGGIVCAGALADRVATGRWHLAHEALTHGATIDDLATAAGLDPDEVRTGLASWADTQHAHGQLTDDEHNTVLALLGHSACRPERCLMSTLRIHRDLESRRVVTAKSAPELGECGCSGRRTPRIREHFSGGA